MSAEVASRQASTRATAPGVADGAALDSLSLFETTARVTAVSFGSAGHPKDATTRATRKRARASSSPERPHATTSASAPSHATREPTPSRRDATARVFSPSSPRNGSEDGACRTAAGWCALPRLRVEARAPPPERVARSVDDANRTDAGVTWDDPSSLDSTILTMLTPVKRADVDPACSF